MAEPMRIGLIGCGFFAQNHLNAWRDLAGEGAVLAAVCDIDPAKAKAAAAEFGAPRWYSNVVEMLDAEKLDLVDIVTRMDTHRAIVTETLARKIPTVVQKPFAPEIEECMAMAEMASKAGTFLAVHENFRFQKPMLAPCRAGARRHDRRAALGTAVVPHRVRRLQDPALLPDRRAAGDPRRRHPHPRCGAGAARRGRPGFLHDAAPQPAGTRRGHRHHDAAASLRRRVDRRSPPTKAAGCRTPFRRRSSRSRACPGRSSSSPISSSRSPKTARCGPRRWSSRCCPGPARPGTSRRRRC